MAEVHTQLEQPKELRKLVLDTALETAEAGKKLNALTTVQKQKTQLKTKIRTTLKELQKQLETFKKSIPPLPTEFIEKQTQINKRQKEPIVPHHLTKDITEIKQRLNKI
jgi:gas vesicle protein